MFTSETFNTMIVAANIQKNNSLSLENHVFGFPRLEIEIFVNFTTTTRNPFWLKFFSCKVQIPPAGGRRTTTSSQYPLRDSLTNSRVGVTLSAPTKNPKTIRNHFLVLLQISNLLYVCYISKQIAPYATEFKRFESPKLSFFFEYLPQHSRN